MPVLLGLLVSIALVALALACLVSLARSWSESDQGGATLAFASRAALLTGAILIDGHAGLAVGALLVIERFRPGPPDASAGPAADNVAFAAWERRRRAEIDALERDLERTKSEFDRHLSELRACRDREAFERFRSARRDMQVSRGTDR